ncbi:MAG TPA: 4-hydroxy-tetrahydrodipicolinate synthase [Fimbriimonadaceae bacterium]|nr:4-hydroxy-tetrahydrodipicolinate synthase [Fimbriimonadaceae bacterium]
MAAFNGPRDWGRLLTAMVTPFHKDGSVNYEEAARIAAHLVDVQKNDGLVISGTTGESPTLSDEEKFSLLSCTLDAVGDRAAVVFGAGTYDTAHSIHLTKEGEKRGAHGIMLVNPYYSKPGQAGLYAHFSTVARETGLPVMLYNIMPRSSINLETPVLIRLANDVANIVAVKEASGNLNQIADVAAKMPAGFRIYSGDDALTLPIIAVGGHGLVSVAAHVAGADPKAVIDGAVAGDLKSAQKANARLVDLVKAVFSAPSPTPIKYMLAKNGFDCEDVRLPLVKLDGAQKAVIDAAMKPFAMA